MGFGQHFEARVGQRIHCNDISGSKQGHCRHCKTMLRTVHDHDVLGTELQATAGEVARDDCPLVRASAVRQIV